MKGRSRKGKRKEVEQDRCQRSTIVRLFDGLPMGNPDCLRRDPHEGRFRRRIFSPQGVKAMLALWVCEFQEHGMKFLLMEKYRRNSIPRL